MTNVGCDDLFNAMEKCKLFNTEEKDRTNQNVIPGMVYSAFPREDRSVPEEKRQSREFIDFILGDDAKKLQSFISKKNHLINLPISVLGKSGYMLMSPCCKRYPEELLLIELAALLGSFNVFNFLLMQCNDGGDFPEGLFSCARYGGIRNHSNHRTGVFLSGLEG